MGFVNGLEKLTKKLLKMNDSVILNIIEWLQIIKELIFIIFC